MSGRSTIHYPEDILLHINKMRKGDAKLTINKAIFILARRGIANEKLAETNDLKKSITSMETLLKVISGAINTPDNTAINTEMFATKLYGILRRYIHEKDKDLLPLCDETASVLYDKTKEN